MRLTLVFAAALAFACASNKPKIARSDANTPGAGPSLASNAGGPNAKGKYVCSYEEPIGSHVPVKVCRYQDADDNNEERNRVQDSLRGPQSAHGAKGQ
jgi:hypothetical protein